MPKIRDFPQVLGLIDGGELVADLPFLDAAARYLADPASLKLARQSERDKAIAAVRRAHAWAQRGLARQQEGKR